MIIVVESTLPHALRTCRAEKETTWTVRNARHGKTFATNRVRHADLIRKMLTDLGEEKKHGWELSSLEIVCLFEKKCVCKTDWKILEGLLPC